MYPQGTKILYTSPGIREGRYKSYNHYLVNEPAIISSNMNEWDLLALIKFDRPIITPYHKLSCGDDAKGFIYLLANIADMKLREI